jgi:hypothetical protein
MVAGDTAVKAVSEPERNADMESSTMIVPIPIARKLAITITSGADASAAESSRKST